MKDLKNRSNNVVVLGVAANVETPLKGRDLRQMRRCLDLEKALS
jgi:hypothetical protein